MKDKETVEEAAARLVPNRTLKTVFGNPYEITPTKERKKFIEGAKWQSERSYSEEDMIAFALFLEINLSVSPRKTHKQLLQQFKKK